MDEFCEYFEVKGKNACKYQTFFVNLHPKCN